nr:hypothetical protein [Tanacetum cinerariifolium]
MLSSFFESLRLVPQSSDTEVICTKGDDGEVMFIEIIRKNDDSREEEPDEEGSTTTEGVGVEYFDMFPTRSKLAYHKYLMKDKGMQVIDFRIVEDISSRLSQVVLERPFVEISNMAHDPPKRVVRSEEDKRRGVEYVMSKILGFYKECLKLGPEYVTGIDDEGEVTKITYKDECMKFFIKKTKNEFSQNVEMVSDLHVTASP